MKGRRGRAVAWCGGLGTVAILAAVAVGLLAANRKLSTERADVTSCANHAIALKMFVREFMEKDSKSPKNNEDFPNVEDAREAFTKMAKADMLSDWDYWARLFKSPASACPPAFRRDGSMGYVFVAGGLKTDTVREEDRLNSPYPQRSGPRAAWMLGLFG